MYIQKNVEYDRIDISENIDIMDHIYVMVVMMSLKAVSIKNLAIINHNGNHYRVNFAFMSKKGAYNLIKNAVIMGEKGTL